MSEALHVYQSVGVLVPLLGGAAFALPLFTLVIKRKVFYDAYIAFFSLVALVLASYNYVLVRAEGKPLLYAFGGWPPPLGISYEVDEFSAVLGVLTASVMFLIVAYSLWYTRFMRGYEWYYTLLLGLETGLLGCLYTGDVFNLFVMLEVLSISAYALVAFYRSRPQAVEAAMKYGIIGATATTIYFIALVFIYGALGTLNMADIALKSRLITAGVGPTSPFSNGLFGNAFIAASLAIALSLWAFTYKAALFPNHFWLPDAHPEAPTPVSAALSGLVVNVGVYAVIRFLYTLFGPKTFLISFRDAVMWALLVLGIASGLVGALLMAVQSDVKRLLAYSTVSHIGLIFMGLSIGTSSVSEDVATLGLTAALYHTVNHSVGKALLFMGVGVFINLLGTRDLDKLSGSGKLSPLVMGAVIVGFLQLMGAPPLGGFFSKLLLYQSLIEAGLIVPAVLVIVISAVSVLGYLKVIYGLWAKPLKEAPKQVAGMAVPKAVALVMAVACIALGVLSPIITGLLAGSINASFTDSGVQGYVNSFTSFAIYVIKHLGGG